MSKLKVYHDKKNKFKEVFNMNTGLYIRSGILDENGKDTGVDPFKRNFPALLDVGIMGHCLNAENGTCRVQCYQGGAGVKRKNMSLENFEKIAKECSNKCFQFALGGRGDVNKHEHFKEILETCKKYEIIPNYTTSGLNITDEEVELSKKYCGAIAVSFYDFSENGYSLNATNKLVQAGITTNIHYVLSNSSIDMAIDYLKNNKFPKGINAVIFLMHKPVGLGQKSNVLKATDPRVKEFFELIDNNQFEFKIGFDSCSVPGILNFTKNINKISIEGCEGALFSGYITAEMIFTPCSFDNDKLRWGVDLNTHTIQEAWDSDTINDFRKIHTQGYKDSCKKCEHLCKTCRPCPITPQISLCNK